MMKKPLLIAVYGNRRVKAVRNKLTGILRYVAEHDEIDLRHSERYPIDLAHDAVIFLNDPFVRIREPTSAVASLDLPSVGKTRVLIDNEAIGRLAAETFLRHGLTNFGYIGHRHDDDAYHSEQRLRAYRKVLRRHGHSPAVFEPGSGGDMTVWIASLAKPCGIFAFNDILSLEVMNTCRLLHIRIPDQVAIIGVDNDPDICEISIPTLSSIDPDFEKAGYLIAQCLHAKLQGRKCAVHHYGVRSIIERDSTRSLKSGGRIVTMAQSLMRQSADQHCSVEKIARQLNVSMSLLNLRFREIVGHGPKEEFEEIRLRLVERQLRDRSLSIAEVAYRCGFQTPEDLHRFFKRKTKLTPTQWRRS